MAALLPSAPTLFSSPLPRSSSPPGSALFSCRGVRPVKCKAAEQSSSEGVDAAVYQGVYGPWTVEASDVREVLLYRSGLVTTAASFIIPASTAFLPEGTFLGDIIRQNYDLFYALGVGGLGLSLLLIHIYVTPIKRTLQSFWLLGAAGSFAAYLSLAQPHGESLIQYVVENPVAVWFVGPLFAALTGLVFKPTSPNVLPDSMALQLGMVWEQMKAPLIIPLLKLGLILCLIMSLMLFVERVYMGIVIFFVKFFGRNPDKRYKWEPINDDVELGSSAYPKVLVQIPMFNEKEVYQLSIGAACGLSWPSDRLVIQVLDDSTDPVIKEMVELECQRWAGKGINIRYQIRDNRRGYKAGALKEGMKHGYVKQCEHVVIFDADFQPEPDFLRRAIPFLVHNPDIALVQARWRFVNANECLMTRMQEMSLDYHFTVEQEVGSSTHAFFGFNGTAGVWRIAAIEEAGGWKDRTTVEDMDLAVRAGLKGWKFVYLGDLQVKSELPSTFKAFRYQQHRWSCGPANLLRKMSMEILRNKKVSAYKKFYVLYSFFLVRKVTAHMVTFFFYCVVMPTTVFFPEIEIPKWAAVYIPSIITVLNAVGTPRSIHLLMYWILFENVMSMHRTKATLIGLLEAGRVNEWVVTEKLGDALKLKPAVKAAKKLPRFRIGGRINLLELVVGAYLFFCACYDVSFGKNHYYIYLYLQAITFFIIGFGFVGTFVPTS